MYVGVCLHERCADGMQVVLYQEVSLVRVPFSVCNKLRG